jgi:hypothetical protein
MAGPVPSPIYGMTLDAVDGINKITNSLGNLQKKPTARIVFDEFVQPSYYRDPVVQIKQVSYVMGELLDSFYVPQYSVNDYLQRTRDYTAQLGDAVDIWEVGNEVNGEWLGNTPDVVAKISGAYDIVKGQGHTAALTLYYNAGCYAKPANEMFTWAAANVPDRMKQGLDYVLISYYEDDCENLHPDWQPVFDKLHAMFPNSKIGFGEVGTSKKAKKQEYMQRYYSTKITTPNFIGGYFWWYGKQDLVPMWKNLWQVFNNVTSNN